MAQYRTARGKVLDMSALAARNERKRAIGINQKVNARGDTIDSKGNIIIPVTKKAAQSYDRTVGTRAINLQAKDVPVSPKVATLHEEDDYNITDDELGFDTDEDLAIEEIKAKESPAILVATESKKTTK